LSAAIDQTDLIGSVPTASPQDEFLVFGAPQIEDAEIDEVVDSMRAAWLGTGPKVAQFEEDFRAYKHAVHAVAVNSCTAALHVSLVATDIGVGDEVITTPLTICATINAILHAGATPVLADVDATTLNIDPLELARLITPRTKALLPVHFAGRPCEMDELMRVADQHGLLVIEDCAHAIETEFRGQKAGTIGDVGCFSFYATKNLTTGEGGMAITGDGALAERMKMLALHGMTKDAWKRFNDSGYQHYYVMAAGFKYNMMDLQAAIGIHQLRRVEANWLKRRNVWNRYQEAFADTGLLLPAAPGEDTRHAYHLYTPLVEKERCGISRDELLKALTARRIGVGVHYLSIGEHPYYQESLGIKADDWPNAMRIGRTTISLPLSARLTDTDVERVIDAVHDCLRT
jgi:dTDP-4-amino-4,6-dideoxygalactose transaminase